MKGFVANSCAPHGKSRSAYALASTLALLVFALLSAGTADARAHPAQPRIVAPATAEAGVRYAAEVPGVATRVTFYVDGERRWQTSSHRHRFRRSGYLPSTDLGVGRHLLAVTARGSNGRVLSARHVIYIASSSKTNGHGKPAPEPTPTTEPAPEPAPEPTPSAAPSPELLFHGGHLADFDQIQAAPNAITEVSDPLGSGEGVFNFTVSDKDVYPVTPTDNPRAQALSPSLINSGDEIWLKTKFMLPQSFPSSVPGWMSLISIYGPPFGGSSPWRIGIEGGDISWVRNGTYGYDEPWRMPLTKGRWITVLLHERFASDGWVEMWVDGNRVAFFQPGTYNPAHRATTDHLAMATMDLSNNGGANAAKIMQYRQAGMFDSATVYFGALDIGRSRASVEG